MFPQVDWNSVWNTLQYRTMLFHIFTTQSSYIYSTTAASPDKNGSKSPLLHS